MLPALGEGGVLRDDARVSDRLRLPIEAEAIPAPIVPEHGETEAAWREFHDRLRAFVSRRVRHAADAEDIVQRVFLQMHRTLPAVRSTDRLGAWLYQSARNAIADHYRAPARRREIPSGDTRPLDGRDSGGSHDEPDEAELACAAECLSSVIGRLPETYRQAFFAHFKHQLAHLLIGHRLFQPVAGYGGRRIVKVRYQLAPLHRHYVSRSGRFKPGAAEIGAQVSRRIIETNRITADRNCAALREADHRRLELNRAKKD